MSTLLTNVLNIQSPKIAVIGDYMLDEIVSGDAERLSPDAPVPVLEVRSVQSRAGGAGNVARCLKAMGASVQCFGVLGNDQEGTLLKQLLDADGICTANLIAMDTRPTTVKRSIVGLAQHRHPQKMFRIDRESKEKISDSTANVLLDALSKTPQHLDVVCIEDYNKGVLSNTTCARIIGHCKDAGIEVIVDPAGIEDYKKYQNNDSIKNIFSILIYFDGHY